MHPDQSATPAAKLEAGNLLTDAELATLYGVALQTVRNWRTKGEGPKWVRIGARAIRYKPADVRAFIEGKDAAA
jgi:predicted DNA-binding transcriptional regulator AlpA